MVKKENNVAVELAGLLFYISLFCFTVINKKKNHCVCISWMDSQKDLKNIHNNIKISVQNKTVHTIKEFSVNSFVLYTKRYARFLRYIIMLIEIYLNEIIVQNVE